MSLPSGDPPAPAAPASPAVAPGEATSPPNPFPRESRVAPSLEGEGEAAGDRGSFPYESSRTSSSDAPTPDPAPAAAAAAV